MSTQKKTVENEFSMEEKIESLYRLQQIDSKIDEIEKIKGELPLEVQDLEDEVAGLQTRIDNINAEVEELSALTRQRRRETDESKLLIEKYEAQQQNVRNNREFEAINKEIEYQKLNIELYAKKLKEYAAELKVKKKVLEDAEAMFAERNIDLESKRNELNSIEAETAEEMAALRAEVAEAQSKIDERLLNAYQRIRKNMRNGLAVVTVKRDACGGCFNRIPPQRQVDIRQNKKIIICEYCGRILVNEPSVE